MKLEMKWGALRALRYSPEVAAMLEQHGNRVLNRANQIVGEDGYTMSSRPGRINQKGRHRVTVAAWTVKAKRHEAKYHTLLRLIGGA